MPVDDDKRKQIARNLLEYSNVVQALNILKAVLKAEGIDIRAAKQIVDEVNQDTETQPSLMVLIQKLIECPDKAHWNQGVIEAAITTEDKRIFNVKIVESQSGDYEIEITHDYVLDPVHGQIQIQETLKMPKFTYSKKDQSIHVTVSQNVQGKDERVAVEFDKNKPTPRDPQNFVINEFARALHSGKRGVYALMGTGTGKSWVIAGITHSLPGESVIIVPDGSLAEEMRKDAIQALHGKGTEVILAKGMTIRQFEQALANKNAQLILQADDELFDQKVALIRDKVVCIDESHQHTFKEEGRRILHGIKENNFLFALTATPTSELINDIFEGEKPIVDMNLYSAMEAGNVRQMYPEEQKGLSLAEPESNEEQPGIASATIIDYFGNDQYITKGKGFLSPQSALDKVKGNKKEAVDLLIQNNRLRGVEQKNFIFSGELMQVSMMLGYYETIQNGGATGFWVKKIKEKRRETEKAARAQYYEALGEDHEDALQLAEQDVSSLPEPNLAKEIEDAQKRQVAQSINSHALSIFMDGVVKDSKNIDFEKGFRTHEIEGQLKVALSKGMRDVIKLSDSDIKKKLIAVAPNLRDPQRKVYITEVEKVVKNLRANFGTDSSSAPEKFIKNVFAVLSGTKEPSEVDNAAQCLLAPDAVDLGALKATYVGNANDCNTSAKEAEILDQLRTGLVMHIGSSKKFTTGISIPSVLSVQQIVTQTKDPLNSVVETLQLFGRCIRDKDFGAKVFQAIADDVGYYVSLKNIVMAADQGEQIDRLYKLIEQYDHEINHGKSDRRDVRMFGSSVGRDTGTDSGPQEPKDHKIG